MRLLISILLFALAMSAGPAAKLAKPPTKAAIPKRTDAEIEQTVRASFAKSKISADHFMVHVKGGVATIDGKTDIIQRKGWATRYAKLGGATQVLNNIQVSEAAKNRARLKLAAAREKRKAAPPAKHADVKSVPPKVASVKTAVVKTPGTPAAPVQTIAPPPATTTASATGVKRAMIKH